MTAVADLSGRSGRIRLWAIVLALAAAAAGPRLVNLGALSFFGDEETSALPAKALLEGRGATMPTGMEYRRELPLTWAAATSARLFGSESEAVYPVGQIAHHEHLRPAGYR